METKGIAIPAHGVMVTTDIIKVMETVKQTHDVVDTTAVAMRSWKLQALSCEVIETTGITITAHKVVETTRRNHLNMRPWNEQSANVVSFRQNRTHCII